MVYATKHLDFDNASLDSDGKLVIDEFKTSKSPGSGILKSGVEVLVSDDMSDTKIYDDEYVDSALTACQVVGAPRLQEWTDIRAHFDSLKE